VGELRVAADAQNLGVELREPTGVRLQDGELAASDRCPVEGIEEHHNILPRIPPIARQRDRVAEVGCEGEIGRRSAHRQWPWHGLLLFVVFVDAPTTDDGVRASRMRLPLLFPLDRGLQTTGRTRAGNM